MTFSCPGNDNLTILICSCSLFREFAMAQKNNNHNLSAVAVQVNNEQLKKQNKKHKKLLIE